MTYTIRSENGIMLVKLNGEMDHHNAGAMRDHIDASITFESPDALLLDLSEINFCDSSGLGFIMGRYRKMQECGGTLTLVNPSAPTIKILRLAGLDKLIRMEITKGV